MNPENARTVRESWTKPAFWRVATVPLVYAAMDCGSDIQATDDQGLTPLHLASAYSQDSAVIRALLAEGAHIDARDEEGATPLHRAATSGHESIT